MIDNGWVKLHRKFVNWEWYDDINTKVLFLHLLMKANHKDKEWRGNLIKRGSFITSLSHLSKETGLSVRKIRTSIVKLESTGEIDKVSTSVNTCITISNYNEYQHNDKASTNDRQTSDKRATTTKNEKNIKNEKKELRARMKKILNGFGKPELSFELFLVDSFPETYLDYWMYLKDSRQWWPTEIQVMEGYRRLEELRKSGNNPVDVIRQTIRNSNKEFYPLKDKEFKTEEIPLPQYLTRRIG